MAILQAQNISFSYYGYQKEIFSNLNFRIDSSWRTGLVGRNGIGKSTLLKILMGELEYQGKIHSSLRFQYFPMQLDLQKTAYEVFLLSHEPYELWQLEVELAGLALDTACIYRPLATLSKGELSKVQLALLFLHAKDFLLIDEPTNHLDSHARQVVCDYLKQKNGFILVSHDRYFLDQCVDHILALNKHSVEVIQGNFSTWYEQKNLRDQFELAQNEKLKKEIHQMQAAASRFRTYSDRIEATIEGAGDKGFVSANSRRMMKHALVTERRMERAMEEKRGLLKDVEQSAPLKLWQEEHPKKELLRFEDVGIYYGTHLVLEGLSFHMEQGERLHLAGKNGSGKSSIIKLILGEDIAHTGKLHLANDLRISYVPQQSSHLKGSLVDWIADNELNHTLFKAILRKLGFGRELFDTALESYSEGQKKKILLAGSLSQKAHLFIWDEPMNYIDLLSRLQIEDIILKYKPALLFVEHDRAFCERVRTKKIDL